MDFPSCVIFGFVTDPLKNRIRIQSGHDDKRIAELKSEKCSNKIVRSNLSDTFTTTCTHNIYTVPLIIYNVCPRSLGPFCYSKLLHKLCQDFLDIQYINWFYRNSQTDEESETNDLLATAHPLHQCCQMVHWGPIFLRFFSLITYKLTQEVFDPKWIKGIASIKCIKAHFNFIAGKKFPIKWSVYYLILIKKLKKIVNIFPRGFKFSGNTPLNILTHLGRVLYIMVQPIGNLKRKNM